MMNKILLFVMLFFTTSSFAVDEQKSYTVALFDHDFIAQMQFEEIAKEFDVRFSYHIYKEFNDVLKAVEKGDADFAANITYSKKRADLFQITSPTNLVYIYFYSKEMPFSEAKTIGLAKGAITRQVLTSLYPEIKIVEYATIDEAIKLIKADQVDGVIDNITLLESMLNKDYIATLINSELPIAPASIIASDKVPPEFLDSIETFMHTAYMQREIRETIEKHQYDIRKRSIASLGEAYDIDLSKPVKIKLENRPAFATLEKNGEVTGIAADIVLEVCEILKANCQILSKEDESWGSMYADLQNNQIDVLAPVSISPKNKGQFYLSNPFYKARSVVVKRNGYKNNVYKELSELIVERIGLVDNKYFEGVISNALPNKELFKYNTSEAKIQGLINQEVDYILLNQIDYNFAVTAAQNNLPIQIDQFFIRPITTEIAFAFPKTERGIQLQQLFNRALKIVNSERIVAQYDVSPNWTLLLQTQKKTETMAYMFFAIIIAIIFIFVFIHYRNSITDELTGLKNRRALYKKYPKGLKKDQTIIYLDITAFKQINDTHGHKYGDEVLVTFADQIKEYWNQDAYRIGGDEFILIGRVSDEMKEMLVEKLTNVDVEFEGIALSVAVSFGYHKIEADEYVKIRDAIHQADLNMYANKQAYYEANLDENRRSR